MLCISPAALWVRRRSDWFSDFYRRQPVLDTARPPRSDGEDLWTLIEDKSKNGRGTSRRPYMKMPSAARGADGMIGAGMVEATPGSGSHADVAELRGIQRGI